jgi:anti-anti-sigma factor
MGSSTNGLSFSFTVDATIPITHVLFAGNFDMQAIESIGDLKSSVPERATGVLLDLSKVSFIDSTGLRRLIELKKELLERDVRLFINKLSPTVNHVMDLSGVADLFDFADGRRTSWWQSFKKARAQRKS